MQLIENPKITYFVDKPEYFDLSRPIAPFVRKECVEERTCNAKDLLNDMVSYLLDRADDVGRENHKKLTEILDIVVSKNGKNLGDLLHVLNCFHGTTCNLSDHYYDRYLSSSKNFCEPPLRKGFWDIENDVRLHRAVPDPELAEVPINAITLFFPDIDTKKFRLIGYFCHGVEENPQYDKIKNSKKLQEEFLIKFKEDVKQKLNSSTADKEICERLLKIDFKVEIDFLENEEILILSFLKEIHHQKLNFLSAFNHSYDIMTVIGRLDHLGIGREYFAHPDIPENFRKVYYKYDYSGNTPLERRDQWEIPGYTHFTDYQFMYLAKRKTGESQLPL
jgi:hypothetical protein